MQPRLAIILAAGEGKRLGPLTASRPKCLVPVNGIPFLERSLRALFRFPFDTLCVVTGYRGDRIAEFLETFSSPVPIHTCMNLRFSETNNGYSLWIALKGHRDLPFLLLDGDLLFETDLLARLLEDPREDLMVVETDRRLLNEESMKVRLDTEASGLWVASLGKSIPLSQAAGESIGMMKLSARWASLLREGLGREWRTAGREALYYEDFLNRYLADEPPLEVLPVDGLRWAEVDTPEELEAASRLW